MLNFPKHPCKSLKCQETLVEGQSSKSGEMRENATSSYPYCVVWKIFQSLPFPPPSCLQAICIEGNFPWSFLMLSLRDVCCQLIATFYDRRRGKTHSSWPNIFTPIHANQFFHQTIYFLRIYT